MSEYEELNGREERYRIPDRHYYEPYDTTTSSSPTIPDRHYSEYEELNGREERYRILDRHYYEQQPYDT